MTSRTLISGRAGLAVHFQAGRVHSFHLDGPQGLERRQEEVHRLFGDSPDIVAVSGLSPTTSPPVLNSNGASSIPWSSASSCSIVNRTPKRASSPSRILKNPSPSPRSWHS